MNKDRLFRLVDHMNRSGYTAAVVTSRENIRYFVDLNSPLLENLGFLEAYLVVYSDYDIKPIAILPDAVAKAVTSKEIYQGLFDVMCFGKFWTFEQKTDEYEEYLHLDKHHCYVNAYEALKSALDNCAIQEKVVMIEERGINPSTLMKISCDFPNTSFKPTDMELRRIRSIKDGEEIKEIMTSIEIIEMAITSSLDLLKKGGSEKDYSNLVYEITNKYGADKGCVLLGFGPSGAFVDEPQQRCINKGDIVKIDMGCKYHGYWSDLARCYTYKSSSIKQKKFYRALKNGLEEAIQTIKAGVLPSDVFFTIIDKVRSSGIPHFNRNHCGHGIGLELWEYPLIAPENNIMPLEVGMVINIEVPYYEVGFGALTVEDTLYVEKEGCKVLSSLSRELLIL